MMTPTSLVIPSSNSRAEAYRTKSPFAVKDAWGDPSTTSRRTTVSSSSSVAFSNLAQVHPDHRSSVSTTSSTSIPDSPKTLAAGQNKCSPSSTSSRRTTVTSSASIAFSNLAHVYPDHRPSVSTTTSTTLIPSPFSTTPTVTQINSPTVVPAKPQTAIQVFNAHVHLDMIAEYAPNPALLLVNRSFKNHLQAPMVGEFFHRRFLIPCGLLEKQAHRRENGRPNYRLIGTDLSSYYSMIENKYGERVHYFKRQDYTPHMMEQTTPFGIIPINSIDPSYHCYIDRRNDDLLILRRLESNSYLSGATSAGSIAFNPIVLKKVSYFLSMPHDKKGRERASNIFLKSGIIEKALVHDPMYLNRLFRYLFDQIHCLVSQAQIYHVGLYAMVHALFERHLSKLSYEVLHYALLIHLHICLLQLDEDKDKLEYLDTMLAEIKLKTFDKIKLQKPEIAESDLVDLTEFLPDLKRQLEVLLSKEQQKARLAAMQKINPASHLQDEDDREARRKAVLEILHKYFPNLAFPNLAKESSCCIVS